HELDQSGDVMRCGPGVLPRAAFDVVDRPFKLAKRFTPGTVGKAAAQETRLRIEDVTVVSRSSGELLRILGVTQCGRQLRGAEVGMRIVGRACHRVVDAIGRDEAEAKVVFEAETSP